MLVYSLFIGQIHVAETLDLVETELRIIQKETKRMVVLMVMFNPRNVVGF